MYQLFLAPTAVRPFLIVVIVLTSCQRSILFQQTELDSFPISIQTNMSPYPLKAFPLEEGVMNLYFRMIPISEANLYTPFFPDNEPKEVPQFFIGKQELWRIDQWNYETVLKQIMQDRPVLIRQLGRQGFRFENLRQMVGYYNKDTGLAEKK